MLGRQRRMMSTVGRAERRSRLEAGTEPVTGGRRGKQPDMRRGSWAGGVVAWVNCEGRGCSWAMRVQTKAARHGAIEPSSSSSRLDKVADVPNLAPVLLLLPSHPLHYLASKTRGPSSLLHEQRLSISHRAHSTASPRGHLSASAGALHRHHQHRHTIALQPSR